MRDESDEIALYMREACAVPLLTAQQEAELAARCRAGDGSARQQLAAANLRLVVKQARRWRGLGVSLADLVGAGNVGLMIACDRYDPSREYPTASGQTKRVRFSTLACFYIKQQLHRAISEDGRTVKIGERNLTLLRRCREAEAALTHRLGRPARREEVAREVGVTPESLARLLAGEVGGVGAAKGHKIVGHEKSEEFDIPDTRERSADEGADRSVLANAIAEITSQLSYREREILSLRFGLCDGHSYSLEEVGRIFKITKERCRQVEARALLKLRHPERLRRLRALAG